jgi:5-methylcytosine-specific restriction endonuclease McrA
VDEALLDDLLESLGALAVPSRESFVRGVLSIGLRAIEAYILSDAVLLNLAEYWDARVGDADRIIDERVLALTGSTSASLRAHVKQCLFNISREWRTELQIPAAVFDQLVEKQAVENLGSELRCELCGYWFQADDMGADRLAAANRVGCRLASTPHPNRIGDPLKPLGFRNIRFTQLALDHRIPRLGFGSVELDNVRITCTFCNNGKLAYRRSHEAISPIVAGSLGLVPPRLPHSQLRQLAFATAVWHHGACQACGGTPRHAELSIVVPARRQAWLVPWNVTVVCYDCR